MVPGLQYARCTIILNDNSTTVHAALLQSHSLDKGFNDAINFFEGVFTFLLPTRGEIL